MEIRRLETRMHLFIDYSVSVRDKSTKYSAVI